MLCTQTVFLMVEMLLSRQELTYADSDFGIKVTSKGNRMYLGNEDMKTGSRQTHAFQSPVLLN